MRGRDSQQIRLTKVRAGSIRPSTKRSLLPSTAGEDVETQLRNGGTKMGFKRIDHVEIVPLDMKSSIRFYTDILGFTVRERIKVEVLQSMQGHTVEEVAYLTLGDTTIEFIKVLDPTDTRFDPWGIGYRMIALEVDDMDETVEYLKDKGVEITFGPVTLGTAKRAEIADPNGIPIELRQW
jgi:glyoxylase I family protein